MILELFIAAVLALTIAYLSHCNAKLAEKLDEATERADKAEQEADMLKSRLDAAPSFREVSKPIDTNFVARALMDQALEKLGPVLNQQILGALSMAMNTTIHSDRPSSSEIAGTDFGGTGFGGHEVYMIRLEIPAIHETIWVEAPEKQ